MDNQNFGMDYTTKLGKQIIKDGKGWAELLMNTELLNIK